MPVVKPGSKVLVTGANGYVGLYIAQTLLERGYSVRGTVRSAEKGDEIAKPFASYGTKFEYVVVEDITKEGAFDEAVKSVDAIQHVASPANVSFECADPYAEYITPAVNSTTSILGSANRVGSQIKRIVFTSSISAIENPKLKLAPQTIYDESNWGDESVNEVETLGNKSNGMQAYNASKVLAEKAAWDIYNTSKSNNSWDLVTLCPSFVIGPTLIDMKRPTDVKSSLKWWFYFVLQEQPEEYLKTTFSFVDIRDVAKAHVDSLENERAGGERFILSAGERGWQEIRNILYANNPTHFDSGIIPRGNPDLEKAQTVNTIYKNTKSIDLLGVKYQDLKNSFLDTISIYESHGWFSK